MYISVLHYITPGVLLFSPVGLVDRQEVGPWIRVTHSSVQGSTFLKASLIAQGLVIERRLAN